MTDYDERAKGFVKTPEELENTNTKTPEPTPTPTPTPTSAGGLSSITGFLNNPVVRQAIINHPESADLIYEITDALSLPRFAVDTFLSAQYPDIYQAISSSNKGKSNNRPQSEQGPREEQEPEQEQGEPTPGSDIDLMNDAVDYAIQLKNQGWNFPRIANTIYRDYGIWIEPRELASVAGNREANIAFTEAKTGMSNEKAAPRQTIDPRIKQVLEENKKLRAANAQQYRVFTHAVVGVISGVVGLVIGVVLL